MTVMASQITGVSVICLVVCSGAKQRITKAPRHWTLWGEPLVTGGFPSQRASNAETVSIWWRYHASTVSEGVLTVWISHKSSYRKFDGRLGSSVDETHVKLNNDYNNLNTTVDYIFHKFLRWDACLILERPSSPLWRESTWDSWIPLTKISNAENVSMAWRSLCCQDITSDDNGHAL